MPDWARAYINADSAARTRVAYNMQVSLNRDAWCSVLRQCRPFDWYVLRCVCRVLYQLVPVALVRNHYGMQWLLKHAARRDSVSLLVWLRAQHQVPPSSSVYHTAVHAAARKDARQALAWIMHNVLLPPPSSATRAHAGPAVRTLMREAAEHGHLAALQQIDCWWRQTYVVNSHQRKEQLHLLSCAVASAGHVHVLAWLLEQGAPLTYNDVVRAALLHRRHAVLRWSQAIATHAMPLDMTLEQVDALCKIAARHGDVRSLAWLCLQRDNTLLDANVDAALALRRASRSLGYTEYDHVLYCAAVRDDTETMCALYARTQRDACKWAHVCCKHNATRTLRWLTETQAMQQWHATRYWPRLCGTAARHGHFAVLEVLQAAAVRPPWQHDTLYLVAFCAPKHCVKTMLAYCAAHGAPLISLDATMVHNLAEAGRVGALRWMRSRGMPMPSNLCRVALKCEKPAVLHFAHATDAPLCPWPAALCAARMHIRDAARYLAPHLFYAAQ